jgi:hypothetical protein
MLFLLLSLFRIVHPVLAARRQQTSNSSLIDASYSPEAPIKHCSAMQSILREDLFAQDASAPAKSRRTVV